MPMNELPFNVHHGLLWKEIRARSLRRKTLRRLGWLLLSASLMLLGLVLTGCAATSTLPAEPQKPVLMPAIATPIPSVSYSLQVQQLIDSWRKHVTDMFPTSKL